VTGQSDGRWPGPLGATYHTTWPIASYPSCFREHDTCQARGHSSLLQIGHIIEQACIISLFCCAIELQTPTSLWIKPQDHGQHSWSGCLARRGLSRQLVSCCTAPPETSTRECLRESRDPKVMVQKTAQNLIT